MAGESITWSSEAVLDRDLVAPHSEAQKQSDLAMQVALMRREQGDFAGALEKVQEAARIIGGHDDAREAMVFRFIRELAPEQADSVIRELTGRDIERVQRELIRVDAHTFDLMRDFARRGEDEASARSRLAEYVAWLKQRHQSLVNRKAGLTQ